MVAASAGQGEERGRVRPLILACERLPAGVRGGQRSLSSSAGVRGPAVLTLSGGVALSFFFAVYDSPFPRMEDCNLATRSSLLERRPSYHP